MRCNNCKTLKNDGNHPHMCADCVAKLRKTGVRATGIFSPRQWWWAIPNRGGAR